MKDAWRFIVMDSGGQYAVLDLAILMLTLSASNWDMTPTTQCSIHHRTLYIFDSYIILHLYRYSNSSQPIWSTNMYSTSSDRCFGSSNSCPSSSVTSCTHYNDVSLVCSKYNYHIQLRVLMQDLKLCFCAKQQNLMYAKFGMQHFNTPTNYQKLEFSCEFYNELQLAISIFVPTNTSCSFLCLLKLHSYQCAPTVYAVS